MFRPALIALTTSISVLVAPGCKSVSALKQRCLAGEATACESACAKGVPGEGGCFHAGNLRRERAALDYTGSDFKRAAEYFGRSCDGGYGDGCLLAGEMIAAPYTPDPAADKQRTISDKEVKTREKRFERACASGSSAGCERLGDVLIGKNAERAKAAYTKSCDGSAAPADCKKARESEVDQAEKWRFACTRNVADDCTRLGDLLYQVDPPRAVRLFVAECQLRGVGPLVGGVDPFVHERIEAARVGSSDETSPASRPAGGAAYSFEVLSPVVDGPVALTEVLRAFTAHSGQLSACLEHAPARAQGELGLELIVDLTGDTFRTRVSPPSTPIEAARCIESVTEAFEFSPPPAPAKLTLTLKIRDAGASPPPK